MRGQPHVRAPEKRDAHALESRYALTGLSRLGGKPGGFPGLKIGQELRLNHGIPHTFGATPGWHAAADYGVVDESPAGLDHRGVP